MPFSSRVRPGPKASAGRSCRRTKASTVLRGLSTTMMVSGVTGQTTSTPVSGSRTTELAQVEAALLGRPVRTQIVGSLTAVPRKKPLRV